MADKANAGLAYGSMIGSAIEGAYSAYATVQAGKLQKKQFALNAKIAEKQAEGAVERGALEEERQRITTAGIIGKERTSFAAQNVALDDGTALEIQKDTAKWGEIDAMRIRNNAAMEAWGFKMQAGSLNIQGNVAMASAYYNAGGTMLGTAAKTAQQLYKIKSGS